MADLRIFSYLPNPRLYKATIAARYSGATIEVVGAKPIELVNWLWDYDARPLSEDDKSDLTAFARTGQRGFVGLKLYKSDRFLSTNPFGDVPAAFGEDGEIGLFESNSIMRAATRLGPKGSELYGDGDPLKASRIDGFLDRTLSFASVTQRYLLSISGSLDEALYEETIGAFASYAAGIERALSCGSYVAGDKLSLADIAYACELCLLSNEKRLQRKHASDTESIFDGITAYPAAHRHLSDLLELSEFSEDLGFYKAELPEIANEVGA